MISKAVMASLALFSFHSAPGVLAQEKKDDAPPIVIRRSPTAQKEQVPAPDKYPLADAVRALETGDSSAPLPSPEVKLPSISNASPPSGKPSSEVPRDFQPKRDVVLNATGLDAVLISR